jgi:excisionase family DNA binding protein
MGSHEIHLLTVSEAANLLGLRQSRVYTLIREGLLPAVRMGRQIRVSAGTLEKWIADGGQALPCGWRHSENEGSEPNGQ